MAAVSVRHIELRNLRRRSIGPLVVPALYRIGSHPGPPDGTRGGREDATLLASDGLTWTGDWSRDACQAQGRRFDLGHASQQSWQTEAALASFDEGTDLDGLSVFSPRTPAHSRQ